MSDNANPNGNSNPNQTPDNAGGPANGKRRKLLVGILAVTLLAAIAWGAYWALVLRWEESTDDAYVNGDVVQITSQVPGTVVKISANDTDFVKAGTQIGRASCRERV